ncbi:hypothetical protein RMCBS344292_07777 [Rhizopus microsporus]|nr:hypothetical protein RMCBS344292_07777 [Rhizopus microsporus]
MQENKWTSPPETPRNYMPLQTSYPYGNDYPQHPTSAALPGMSSQQPAMSGSQPNTPRPDIISPPPDKLTAAPDLIRRRPPLPSRPASFTTTTFHSNPYPGGGNPSLRRRRTETSMFSFETGPSFSATKQELELWNIDQSNGYQVQIHAKMDRGFFRADQDWTCYRRNYFQVSATFDVHGTNYMLQGPEVPCLLRTENQEIHQVDFFSIGVSAHVSGSDKKIELVQHTPKRDKGPQMVPEPRVVSAGGNLHLASVGSNHNIVTFERMQFKTATANNGKRRAAQQYYEIMIELWANTSTGKAFKVAHCVSAPLVVRGRSPGHYADSHTRYRSMDAGIPSPMPPAFNVGQGVAGSTSSTIVAPPSSANGPIPDERYVQQQQQQQQQQQPSSRYGMSNDYPYSSYHPQQSGGYPYLVGYNPALNTPPPHPPMGGPMTNRNEDEPTHRSGYVMHPYSSVHPNHHQQEGYYSNQSNPVDHPQGNDVYQQENKPYWDSKEPERYSHSTSVHDYGYLRSQHNNSSNTNSHSNNSASNNNNSNNNNNNNSSSSSSSINNNNNPPPTFSALDSSLDAGRSITSDNKHYMQQNHSSSN